MVKLNYNYVGEETPEERLRNKLSPLFTLVNILDTQPGYPKLEELIILCKGNLIEIREHLTDILPFYMKLGEIKYKQSGTLLK